VSEARQKGERLDEEGFAAFAARADEDAPVYMLNLLAFKPGGGRESYERYGEAVAPLLAKAGGRPVYAGQPAAALIGEQSWDLVIVVEYPSRRAFLEMIGSPEYQAIAHLRSEALLRGELHPMDPIEVAGAPAGGPGGHR
jgi:uncharacterized protein (DUF1330 family)